MLHTRFPSSWFLPTVLSAVAGAVDVIGFLALGGLFTAHITGNVVIVAAHYVTGGFSQIGPLLAVPVFVAVMGMVTLVSDVITRDGTTPLRPVLLLETAFLAGFLLLGIRFGPFADADSSIAVVAGILGVSAMATQNVLGEACSESRAIHRGDDDQHHSIDDRSGHARSQPGRCQRTRQSPGPGMRDLAMHSRVRRRMCSRGHLGS